MTPVKKVLGPALLVLAVISLLTAFLFSDNTPEPNPPVQSKHSAVTNLLRISGIVEKGQTLYEIFKRHGLDPGEIFYVKEALAGVHSTREIRPGQPYEIHVDPEKRLSTFVYWVNEGSLVRVTRAEVGYQAEKLSLEYERKLICLEGAIEDNPIANPRKVVIPAGQPVPETLLASFKADRDGLAGQIASAPRMRFETALR